MKRLPLQTVIVNTLPSAAFRPPMLNRSD
jgi:hypothetical protein